MSRYESVRKIKERKKKEEVYLVPIQTRNVSTIQIKKNLTRFLYNSLAEKRNTMSGKGENQDDGQIDILLQIERERETGGNEGKCLYAEPRIIPPVHVQGVRDYPTS